jgi:ABC-2 type transport system ATP-binding protein
MKRKLGIVQALQGDAPLLVLDEPTEGLDPRMQDSFYELLADLRRRERTVFMSSHVLPEVQRVCDRIGLLRDGELVVLATVAELRGVAGRRVRISFADAAVPPPDWPTECEPIELTPRTWELKVAGALGPLVGLLADRPVADLQVQEPQLEDVLREYYARPTRP